MTSKPARAAYLRIADDLRERIGRGDWSPGDYLPAERELTTRFAVSRMTVRRSLQLLQREGLVTRDATRGTRVAEQRIALRLGSFTEEVRRGGAEPTAETIWQRCVTADAHLAADLGCPPGAKLHAIQRLRRVDRAPMALETTYYPERIVAPGTELASTGSLWEELRRAHRFSPAKTSARIEIRPVTERDAALLETGPSAMGFVLRRHTYDAAGDCIEYALDVYRADRAALYVERDFAACAPG